MSDAVVSLPEKQLNSGYDDTPEKIGDLPTVDNAMKLQIVGKAIQYYCRMCKCKTDHDEFKCPDRSKGIGLACSICLEPCEIEEHKLKRILKFKVCFRCPVTGNHWSKDCPDPYYDECDFDDVDQKWY